MTRTEELAAARHLLIERAREYVKQSFARETRTSAELRAHHSPLPAQAESRLALRDAVDTLNALEEDNS